MDGTDDPPLILPTAGRCMRPFIWPGGRLHIVRCSADELEIGQIAVWFDGSTLLSHRVLGRDGRGRVLTRGDLSRTVDSPVEPAQVLGRAAHFSWGPFGYGLEGPLMTLAGENLSKAAALIQRLRACVRRR